ncbi:MAG: beta-propeller domain-containing protein [Nitrososphaerales archaeon]
MEREINRKVVSYSVVAVLLAILLATSIYYSPNFLPSFEYYFPELRTFSSYSELKYFLKTKMEQSISSKGFYAYNTFMDSFKSSPEYSTTNIQVAGVDEADIVKTDGEYLYLVSKNNIYIIRAYPPEQAEIISKINLNETHGLEIYINGDRLIVLGACYAPSIFDSKIDDIYLPYLSAEKSFVNVYDITKREEPVLKRMVSLNGTILGSRMIGNYVYVVFNQISTIPKINGIDFEVNLPKINSNGNIIEVKPYEISYIDVPNLYYYFSTILAINVQNDEQELTYETILTGMASIIYASLNNIYLVIPNTNFLISSIGNEETLIYRIRLNEEKIVSEAQGSVPGYVLNQFSIDEYDGFFRIATTKWTSIGQENDLYILDMRLNIVGELKGLAPNERIYSARFMNDRCYLVTFRQVDPFFVIDLSNPMEPKVLGYLKIPGFSSYLHPYDENNIIGIGMEESRVKLSLFDVTNVSAPIEKAKFTMPGQWSDTPVINEHKAFFFDKKRQLLALPVSIFYVSDGLDRKWQGAFIFDLSIDQGFILKGSITHQTDGFEYDLQVRRILYIDEAIYTISDGKVKINNIGDLSMIKAINLL